MYFRFSVLFGSVRSVESLSVFLANVSCQTKRMWMEKYTNESQIADDLHAHTDNHLMHRVCEQESKYCVFVYVRVWMGKANRINVKHFEFWFFWFFLHLFSIHIIIGSREEKKSRTFKHWISYAGFQNETVRNFWTFRELLMLCEAASSIECMKQQHSMLMDSNWHNYLQTVISSNSYILLAGTRKEKLETRLHASSPFTNEAAQYIVLYTYMKQQFIIVASLDIFRLSILDFKLGLLVFSTSFSIDYWSQIWYVIP